MNTLLLVLLADIMTFISVSCELPGTVDSVNITGFKSIYPIGLKQCEKQCLSHRDCQLLVFQVSSLSCYMSLGTFTGESVGTRSKVVVRQRTDILNGASDFNTTADSVCVTLSSGELACVTSPCGPPPEVVNATINLDTSVIDYSCNGGINKSYTDPPEPIVCKADGQWTTPNFVCTGNTVILGPSVTHLRHEALDYCTSRGAHLLRVKSFEQGTLLITKYQLSGGYHVDGMYVDGTSSWIFSDGDAINLTMFFYGEDGQGPTEGCVVWEVNQFQSIPCSSTIRFKTICEVG
ncbi:uncharacterized protein LOC110452272 [Mizuhopecten yessoensis]|uniref:Sushi domain-containing protein n=1 Tax=Mizuhopecten yessoensis TaxID=6573 RepID=A0A210R510_MIZYE|nr:uncharacterized protein LOC110452272 [Mizuhopecten yessoensis]OWF56055.1 hypothetical protein KP79_PYT20981 [Mizuhopecten yessoensis]